ncbi:hypothetical protein QTP88_018248 [Uroleucon formosanum]
MDWDHNYALPKLDNIEDDLDPDFIPITVNEVEEVVNVFDDSDFVPITEDQVEQVEEDLDDSNFDPDLTPITEHQDNQLIEAAKKKKKFSPADKKAVLEAKSELKNVNAKTKHPNRSLTCPVRCKNKCKDNLSTDHQNFKKSQSRVYKLPDSKKNEVQVCKITLLNVLGYTNDSVLTELVKNMNSNFCMSSVTDNRGQQNIKKCIPKDIVADHIRLYKPSVSHYRRLDAPNIMYLPFGLTVKAMYDDFCSQEFYRQIEIRDNITLLENHKAKALTATSKYKEDSKLNIESTCIYSMDLQKVILIPNMPDTKSSFFTSRLVVFNETFAQLKPNALSYCVLWHEAIAGRKAENVIDSILALISNQRDVQDFIFWADNCTGQNKNWTLYMALVCNLNSTNLLFKNTKSVTMKYLTKSHIHMTADGWKNKKRTTNVKTDTLYGFKMNSIVMAKFSRESTYFLQKKMLKDIKTYYAPKKITQHRGINLNKKKGIINKLVPVMPENRKHFWINLPVSVTSEDLFGSLNKLVGNKHLLIGYCFGTFIQFIEVRGVLRLYSRRNRATRFFTMPCFLPNNK